MENKLKRFDERFNEKKMEYFSIGSVRRTLNGNKLLKIICQIYDIQGLQNSNHLKYTTKF